MCQMLSIQHLHSIQQYRQVNDDPFKFSDPSGSYSGSMVYLSLQANEAKFCKFFFLQIVLYSPPILSLQL